jgi:hypothetical protein
MYLVGRIENVNLYPIFIIKKLELLIILLYTSRLAGVEFSAHRYTKKLPEFSHIHNIFFRRIIRSILFLFTCIICVNRYFGFATDRRNLRQSAVAPATDRRNLRQSAVTSATDRRNFRQLAATPATDRRNLRQSAAASATDRRNFRQSAAASATDRRNLMSAFVPSPLVSIIELNVLQIKFYIS